MNETLSDMFINNTDQKNKNANIMPRTTPGVPLKPVRPPRPPGTLVIDVDRRYDFHYFNSSFTSHIELECKVYRITIYTLHV